MNEPFLLFFESLFFVLLEFTIITTDEVNNVLAVESCYPLISWINFHTMSIGFRGDK